jgi:hypothetical protein
MADIVVLTKFLCSVSYLTAFSRLMNNPASSRRQPKEDRMAEVVGFNPARTGQKPEDGTGSPVFVGVWGDSTTGVGVFGTSGAVSQNATNIPIINNNAGVVGHNIENADGVLGAGVWGESIQGQGVVARSQSGSGVLGVTSGQPPNAGVFGSSTTGGYGVAGFSDGAW